MGDNVQLVVLLGDTYDQSGRLLQYERSNAGQPKGITAASAEEDSLPDTAAAGEWRSPPDAGLDTAARRTEDQRASWTDAIRSQQRHTSITKFTKLCILAFASFHSNNK